MLAEHLSSIVLTLNSEPLSFLHQSPKSNKLKSCRQKEVSRGMCFEWRKPTTSINSQTKPLSMILHLSLYNKCHFAPF